MNIDWSFQQDAIYKELTGHDGWDRPSYKDEVPVKVRWQFKQKLVRTANGEEEVCDAEVWAPVSISPKIDDRFVYEGKLYRVINASLPPSLYGETGHWKLYCKAVVQ